MTKNVSYRLQFIDSARFIISSLSNFVNNFSEKIRKIKCRHRHDGTKYEIFGIKCKYCDCLIEHTYFNDNLRQYKCLVFDENYKKSLMKA